MGNFLTDAWKGLAQSSGDAAEKAADALVAVSNQSIELVNKNTESARVAANEGAQTALSLIEGGGDRARGELIDSSTAGIQSLQGARDSQIDLIRQGADIANDRLMQGGLVARADIERGLGASTAALGAGRSASLDAINKARGAAIESINQGTIGATGAVTTAKNQIRSDFDPFLGAGQRAVQGLEGLITDPNQQKAFIENNPFYDSLASDSERRLLQNQAARGKVGSGGTAEALQQSLLRLGTELLNNNIAQRMGLTEIGMNAAQQVSGAEQNSAKTIADLLRAQGVDIAGVEQTTGRDTAGIETAYGQNVANLNTGAAGNLANIATGVTGAMAGNVTDAAARGAEAIGNAGTNIANTQIGLGTNLANTSTSTANNMANTVTNNANNQANLITGNSGSIVDLLLGRGNAEAGGIVGERNAQVGALNTVLNTAAMLMGVPPGAGPQHQEVKPVSTGGTVNTSGANKGTFVNPLAGIM